MEKWENFIAISMVVFMFILPPFVIIYLTLNVSSNFILVFILLMIFWKYKIQAIHIVGNEEANNKEERK